MGGGDDFDELDLERFGGRAGGVPELLTGVEIEFGDRSGDGIGLESPEEYGIVRF